MSTVEAMSSSSYAIQLPPRTQTAPPVTGTSSSVPVHMQHVARVLSPHGVQAFLKGHPKALGTVQIMIGLLSLLLGIASTVYADSAFVFTGVPFWASAIYIIAGSLAVAAENQINSPAALCLMNGSLGMNVFSAIAAGIAIIFLSLDLVNGPNCRYCTWHYDSSTDNIERKYRALFAGISVVLLLFAILELVISICLSGFACNADSCCNTQAPTVSQAMYPQITYTSEVPVASNPLIQHPPAGAPLQYSQYK